MGTGIDSPMPVLPKSIIEMKKLFFSLLMVTLVFAGYNASAQSGDNQQNGQWKKSSTGTWQGKKDNTEYWYKRNQEGKLNWSTDNKNWVDTGDNHWVGYDGKLYRIENDKLSWSSDNGKTWTTSSDRAWRGSDGNWYMFDTNWILWTGGNGTLPPTHTD